MKKKFMALLVVTSLIESDSLFAESFSCKVLSCMSTLGPCNTTSTSSEFHSISVVHSASASHIEFCSSIPESKRIPESPIHPMCDRIPFQRVEVRGYCSRRGNADYQRGHEDYCGERRKFYRFDDQSDLQLALDYGQTNTFIYNNGFGVVIAGTCDEQK